MCSEFRSGIHICVTVGKLKLFFFRDVKLVELSFMVLKGHD